MAPDPGYLFYPTFGWNNNLHEEIYMLNVPTHPSVTKIQFDLRVLRNDFPIEKPEETDDEDDG